MRLLQRLEELFRRYHQTHGYSCDACKAEIFEYPMRRLCQNCETALLKNDKRTCPKCGRKTAAEGVCLACKSKTPAFTAGVSPFVYQGKTASLINHMKNGNRRLPTYFGEKMAEAFLDRFPDIKTPFSTETLWILPVPLTKTRLRERGYNQAEELASAARQRLSALGVNAQTDNEVLQKREDTKSQKYLGGKDRVTNAEHAFHLHKRSFCKDKTFLLIDDIVTTGATGDACSKLLLRAGAKAVYFLAAAALPERENSFDDGITKTAALR